MEKRLQKITKTIKDTVQRQLSLKLYRDKPIEGNVNRQPSVPPRRSPIEEEKDLQSP
jgi:hypothetical protein